MERARPATFLHEVDRAVPPGRAPCFISAIYIEVAGEIVQVSPLFLLDGEGRGRGLELPGMWVW